MLNIKKWLENGTNLNVVETCFKKEPKLPYIIFTVDENRSGADDYNNISNRNVTIEFYSEILNKEKETIIEKMLNEKSISYSKNRMWIDSERMFQTSYDFNLYEKMEV